MGSIISSSLGSLGLGDSNSASSNTYGYNNNVLQCCPGIVDPLTLFAVVGSIIALTFFLRQAIIDKVMAGRRRRDVLHSVAENLIIGTMIFYKTMHKFKI